MISELFKLMLKEEVRIHTTLFPRLFFYMFPVVAFLFSFIIATLVNDTSYLANLFYIIVFFAGISSGAYGLEARELYLRKFPHLNFLLYTYFAMPIKNEIILFAMFLKEIAFTFFWFLLPFLLGLFTFNPMIIFNLIALFLFANSLSFFLSNVYNKKKIFYPALLIVAALLLVFFEIIAQNFWLNILLFIVTFILAMKTVNLEYYSKKVFHKNQFDRVSKYLRSPLLTKDFIDLKRSYGLARIIVSVIFPIICVYILMALFQKIIGLSMGTIISESVFYSLMLGLVSLAVYDTVVEFDRWDFYSIFPMKKSDLIKSKLKTSLLVSVPLMLVLIFLLARENFVMNVLIGLVSMFYFISIIVYLVGLETRMLLDFRKILVFSIFFTPYFLLIFFSIKIYSVLAVFALLSLVFLRYGIKRFD